MPLTVLNKLPNKAKSLWESTFKAAKSKHSEERAAKIAWSAVKKKYKKKGDKWVARAFIENIVLKSEPLSFKSAELVARSEGEVGEKEYFVEGYLATTDVNRDGLQIAPEFLEKLKDQIVDSKINIKGDLEHVKSLMEQGKKVDMDKIWTDEDLMLIRETEVNDGKLWVKVLLNKYVKNFDKVWYDIKQGFKDSFSVEFHTNQNKYEMIPQGDKMIKYVKDGDIHRFCLTGTPMNQSARVLKSYVKETPA